jgi:hypothetical protein
MPYFGAYHGNFQISNDTFLGSGVLVGRMVGVKVGVGVGVL